ncbi:hypothetical protein CR513_05566, partial [Mucuna pruriens]
MSFIKYTQDLSHVLEPNKVQIREDLTYEARPMRIKDQRMKQLKGKEINLVKVVWSDTIGDAMLELVKMESQKSQPRPKPSRPIKVVPAERCRLQPKLTISNMIKPTPIMHGRLCMKASNADSRGPPTWTNSKHKKGTCPVWQANTRLA